MTRVANPAIVGVILSKADLNRAIALGTPPHFFELRLDSLATHIGEIEGLLGKLTVPVIITARHPAEGGMNQLRSSERRSLLLRFMHRAALIDVELRSARAFRGVLEAARARNVGTIISFHDFNGTPTLNRLEGLADAAWNLGADFVKISSRTDTQKELVRLHDFFSRQGGGGKVALMGFGKLGRRFRLEIAARGSALNYAHLGKAGLEGQLSIAELRRILKKKSHRQPLPIKQVGYS